MSGDPQAMDDGQLAVVKERVSGASRGCKPKNPSRSTAVPWTGHRACQWRCSAAPNSRPLAERHDHVQAVDRAALEDGDQHSARGRLAAARARNSGAKPRLTSASPPFFRKMRREVIGVPIASGIPATESQCRRLRGGGGFATVAASTR
jgi:hypothetical protein